MIRALLNYLKEIIMAKKEISIYGMVTVDGVPTENVRIHHFVDDIIVAETITDGAGNYQVAVERRSSGKIASRLGGFDFEPAWYYYSDIKKSVRVDFSGHISQNPT